ncbi:FAD-dependent oxidoreductase [Pseudomonas sp.]|uniref:FAD-dependent oxidoreductase n=1 Tax=Pseudomonas sp. TaxID=306 RepID=UPI003D6FDA40
MGSDKKAQTDAALTAARLGQKVALIHDRPVLGGNANNELGLMPRGSYECHLSELKDLVSELTACDHEHPAK